TARRLDVEAAHARMNGAAGNVDARRADRICNRRDGNVHAGETAEIDGDLDFGGGQTPGFRLAHPRHAVDGVLEIAGDILKLAGGRGLAHERDLHHIGEGRADLVDVEA